MMFTCRIDDELELRPLDTRDAPALFALVDANRAYLREWLPWLDSNREEQDTRRFITWSRRQLGDNKDVIAGMWYRGALVGVVSLDGISSANSSASIGYWIAEKCQGRGIVTRATRAMLDYAFRELQLNRIEIRCAPGNARSQAVPLRLGFTREGTLRETERLYNRFEDSVVFGVLRTEWLGRGKGP
jgi:ribosomal-protein-serine acetyltransferase